MRLSSRLSDKSQSNGEVETFIDWAKYTMTPEDVTDEVHLLSTGDFVEIQIVELHYRSIQQRVMTA